MEEEEAEAEEEEDLNGSSLAICFTTLVHHALDRNKNLWTNDTDLLQWFYA